MGRKKLDKNIAVDYDKETKGIGNSETIPSKSKSEAPKKDNLKKIEALDKEITPEENKAFSAFLGKVKVISAKESGRNTTIFIDGIKSTLIDDPAVKKCPLHFRWRKKENMVKDGSGAVNRGYSVVSKTIMKDAPFKLTVSRDDTPTEDVYTVGDSILCCTIKDDFEKRKLETVLKSIRRPKQIKEQRNEFAKQQAKNTDVEQVTDNYANVNTGDSKLMPSKFKAPKDYNEMIEKAKKEAGESDGF